MAWRSVAEWRSKTSEEWGRGKVEDGEGGSNKDQVTSGGRQGRRAEGRGRARAQWSDQSDSTDPTEQETKQENE